MKNIPLAFTLLVLLGWTGGDGVPQDSTDEPLAAPRVLEVRMVDKGGGQWRFEPADIQANSGDVVVFIQDDIAPHNVQFKDVPEATDLGAAAMGPFLLQKGQTYQITIDDRFAPGTHDYVCTPHEPLGMIGTIEVSAPAP